MPNSVREAAGDPLKVSEHPVAPLAVQPGQRVGEKLS
jgi:hypothetical protein